MSGSDFKWVAIMFIGLFAAMAIDGICQSIQQATETRAAMEAGYEQVVEDGETLWKPRTN